MFIYCLANLYSVLNKFICLCQTKKKIRHYIRYLQLDQTDIVIYHNAMQFITTTKRYFKENTILISGYYFL